MSKISAHIIHKMPRFRIMTFFFTFPTQLYNLIINRILFFPSYINAYVTFLMNHKVGKLIYKLFSHGVLYWVNFSRKKHKTISLLTLCEFRKLCSIHSEMRGINLLIMSRFDPLKELCSVILLFLGFFIKTQIKSNNDTTNAYFIRLKKLEVKDSLCLSAMCFCLYINPLCVKI